MVTEHVVDSLGHRRDGIITGIYSADTLVRIAERSHVLRLARGEGSGILCTFDGADRLNALLNGSVGVIELEVLRDVLDGIVVQSAQLSPSVSLACRLIVDPASH